MDIRPDHARNMRLVGHSDQGGRGDGVQLMVNRGHAYVGHMFSKGFSIIDVRDPANPRTVNYIEAPFNTWNIHLQTHEDLLLVVNAKDMFASEIFQDERAYYKGALGKKVGTAEPAGGSARDWTAGMSVYDISRPSVPRLIGFLPVEGGGVHRIWYTGGRWAYLSVLLDGFTDYIFMTVDMTDATEPREAGRFWLPGMNLAAGETPANQLARGVPVVESGNEAAADLAHPETRAGPGLLDRRHELDLVDPGGERVSGGREGPDDVDDDGVSRRHRRSVGPGDDADLHRG